MCPLPALITSRSPSARSATSASARQPAAAAGAVSMTTTGVPGSCSASLSAAEVMRGNCGGTSPAR